MPTRIRHISDLASKMADFLKLDAAALGCIRKSSEDPPRISVYDLISCITGLSASNSKTYWDRLAAAFPEVTTNCGNLQFPGPGQRHTPVVDAHGAVLIIMLLPGLAAATFRMEAGETMCASSVGI